MEKSIIESIKALLEANGAMLGVEIKMADFEILTSKYICEKVGKEITLNWNPDEETGMLFVQFDDEDIDEETLDKLSDLGIVTEEWYEDSKAIVHHTFGTEYDDSAIYVSLDLVDEMDWADVPVVIPLSFETIQTLINNTEVTPIAAS